jgi:hypothetical protein
MKRATSRCCASACSNSVTTTATSTRTTACGRWRLRRRIPGSHWFRWCCEREALDPDAEFARLIAVYARGSLRGPFNREARIAAGFDAAELLMLETLTP